MPPRSARILPVLATCLLFLMTPLLGGEQRFGAPGGRQAAVGQAAATSQGQRATGQPQRSGGPGRDLFFTEWWKDAAVRKELNLSDRQANNISRFYEERVQRMKPLDDEYRKQSEELERLTRERTVDVNVYSIQVTRVEALRTELHKTRVVMLYSIYRVLSPEQYQKLVEIRDRRRAGRSGGPR
jgi:Spy/CpxP family protein refolding chaperone